MKPTVMVIFDLPASGMARLRERYDVIHLPKPADLQRQIADIGAGIQAVLTNGTTGLSAAQMDAMPQLQIIAVYGAGYENVDLAAASSRRIAVTYGRGTNDASVADHAMALLFAIVRGIPQADQAVRRGEWNRDERPSISGKRLGILGLGRIGVRIAQRASAFDMTIAYHNRRPRQDVPYRYSPTVVQLAANVDFLIVACPGGPATFHLVNHDVLVALGASGFIVNVARGSVVDNDALIRALSDQEIAGAALDVIEGEPSIPDVLRKLPNIVFTPHIAGRSPETSSLSIQLVIDNLDAHFAGRPLLTPVPAN